MIGKTLVKRTAWTLAAALWIVVVAGAAFTWCQTATGQEAAGQQAESGKSSPDALSMYADAANYQNKGAYALAADEWTRFLERFPQDPLVSKARHYLGVCQLQLKQFDKAAEAFALVVSQNATFEHLEDAYLNLGWCQYSLAGSGGDQDRYQQAVETFSKLVEKFPDGKYVDQALFFQGESLYAMGKKREASVAYGQLVTKHAESRLRCEALYAMGVALEETAEYTHAARAYDMFLKDCADSELAAEVGMRKAETTLQLGDAAAAEKMFAQAAAIEGFAAADHALYRQAFCATRQDKFAEAGQLYRSLVERFPESTYLANAIISAGRSFYRAEQYDEAAKWMDQVMAGDGPDKAEAAHWRSRIYLRSGDPAAAAALVEKNLPAAGDSAFLANLKLDHADAMFEQPEHRGESLAEYLAVYESHPQHEIASQSLYNAAFAALELKQFDQAISLGDQFRKTFPDDSLTADVQYVEAEGRLQKKEYAEAESLYAALLKQFPTRSDVDVWRLRLAVCLYLQKNYQAAIEFLSPLRDKLTSPAAKAEASYWIGASQFALNQFDQANASLQASLAADAKWARADETLLSLARTQLKLNKLDEARKSIELLQQSFPDSGSLDQAWYQLGEIDYARSDYPQAVAAYDQVIAKWPQSDYVPYALYGKGWGLLKSLQYEEAAKAFTGLIDGHAEHRLLAEAHFARGMCRRQTGQFDQALQDIGEFLKSEPAGAQRADALYERGLAEAAAKQYPAAIKTFETLIKDQPTGTNADKVLYELAWAHSLSGNSQAAVSTFAQLAEQHPDSDLASEASFHVGEQAYAQKDYAAAVNAYTQAKKQRDNAALAEKVDYKLAWSHYQLQQYEKSLEQFTQHLQQFPAGSLAADVWFMRAECLFKLKNYAEALPAFLEAGTKEPSSAQIAVLTALHGGQAAGQLEKWQQSLELLEPIPQKFPDSPYLAEARFEIGRCKQKLGREDEALADYRWVADESRSQVGARTSSWSEKSSLARNNTIRRSRIFNALCFATATKMCPRKSATGKPKPATKPAAAARSRSPRRRTRPSALGALPMPRCCTVTSWRNTPNTNWLRKPRNDWKPSRSCSPSGLGRRILSRNLLAASRGGIRESQVHVKLSSFQPIVVGVCPAGFGLGRRPGAFHTRLGAG